MAFTSPMTAVTGATFTAAQFNTNVRDNLNAIWVGTTAGDIDYYTSATAKSRLGIGTSGRRLKSDGSVPSWAYGGVITYLSQAVTAGDVNITGSTSFQDVTGLSLSPTLSAGPTYTVVAFFAGSLGVTNAAGPSDYARVNISIDGTSMGSATWPGMNVGGQTVPVAAVFRKTGVASGSRTIKVQAKTENASETAVVSGTLICFALEETS